MTNVKRFWIEETPWAGDNGETLYFITDGVSSRGGYSTKKEAQEKIEGHMWDWEINS
ncbi:hypothetical protein P4637_03130 [Halalkalibacterium halodurans]|uniref:hypothetical protein n=1 Tax=Halalkalibacterium halodurans TaxID=86665 RepID=UPI002E20C5D9|nr:hypothetical protein [Halalkalibacterium halodurans]MED4105493.1 hypothetical protein [Halalkalibacterium halodurans]MED4109301.1 hypothetical protein [Halalkalibacterium halodurans]MED4149685.1 hypothetical protein [Halalkalibacterium halodurans]